MTRDVLIEGEGGEQNLFRFEYCGGSTFMSLGQEGKVELTVGRDTLTIRPDTRLEVIIRELPGVCSSRPRGSQPKSDDVEITVVRGCNHFPVTLGRFISVGEEKTT